MPWALAVIQQSGGGVVLDSSYSNWVSLGDLPGKYGLYMVSDTLARLNAADSITGVYGICAMTEAGDLHWAELDNIITAAKRTKINTFLAANGYPTIPAAWTNKQAVIAILKRISAKFELDQFYVEEKA